MCGNKIIYDGKITRLRNNEVIYSSEQSEEKIDTKISSLNYPMIFLHTLHNKIPVGVRAVVAKGKFFKSFASDNSTIFLRKTLPKNEYFMVEFYNLHEAVITKTVTFPHRNAEPLREGGMKANNSQKRFNEAKGVTI